MSTTTDDSVVLGRLTELVPRLQLAAGWYPGSPPVHPERFTGAHLVIAYRERWTDFTPDDVLLALAVDVVARATRALDAAMAAVATPLTPEPTKPLTWPLERRTDDRPVLIDLPVTYGGATGWLIDPHYVVDICARTEPNECKVFVVYGGETIVDLSPRDAADRLGFRIPPRPDDAPA